MLTKLIIGDPAIADSEIEDLSYIFLIAEIDDKTKLVYQQGHGDKQTNELTALTPWKLQFSNFIFECEGPMAKDLKVSYCNDTGASMFKDIQRIKLEGKLDEQTTSLMLHAMELDVVAPISGRTLGSRKPSEPEFTPLEK